MKVRATQPGFLGFLREAGDEFDVEKSQFSARWMEELKPAKGKKEEPPADLPAGATE